MAQNNFERMMELVNDVFDTRNDPEQLDVNEEVINRLLQMHPATLSQRADENGPIAWILVIPTTPELMNKFCAKEISELDLFNLTSPGIEYEAIYLCSATMLPEYRGKGIAKQMTIDAINAIRESHPVQALFVWPFSKEGEALADSVAGSVGLPLLKRY